MTINRGYKANHKIAGPGSATETKGVPCDDCKAWNKNGTDYYLCAVEGHCPALEENREDGLKLYAKLILEANNIKDQFDKQIKG